MTQSTNQPGAADLSKRTPEEVFAHHGQALGAEDLDATVMDFAATAVLVTPYSSSSGLATPRGLASPTGWIPSSLRTA